MTQNESIQPESMKHPEQGRSMIEMLGTLAIMGVLSIGGIAGYSYAVTKYKANETIDELNNRAIVYATQLKDGDLLSGTALRNGEFGDKTVLGYGVSATVSEYENEFNVTLSEIPFEVCEQILKNYTIPTEISVNGNIYNDMDENIDICGEGDTNMIFAFNGDLSNDWESVEVSGEPNNGETTELQTITVTQTQTATISHTITQTYSDMYCGGCDSGEVCAEFCDADSWDRTYSCSVYSRTAGYTSPYGGTWYQVFANSNAYPEYWTGEEICAKYGLRLPSLSKLVKNPIVDWDIGSKQYELTELGLDLANHFSNLGGIFTSDETEISQIIFCLNSNCSYAGSNQGIAHDDYRRCNTVYQGAFLCYE